MTGSADYQGDKVLIVISSSSVGGAQTHVEWLAQNAQPYHAVVMCPEGYLFDQLRLAGIEVYPEKNFFLSVAQMASIIIKRKIKVVHAHLLRAALFSTLACLFTPRTRLIYTVHNHVVYPGMKTWKRLTFPMLTRLVSPRIGRFIAVSNHIGDYLVKTLKIPAGKLSVIHNGVSFMELEMAAERGDSQQLVRSLPAGSRIIGAVGRVVYQKGHDVLVRAFGQLAVEFSNLHCVIVGGGEWTTHILSLAERLGVGERVHLLGFRRDVLNIFRSMDVVVFPSRFEGLPISVIEAAYSGKPIVATDIEGINDIVQNDFSGILVPSDNSEALATAIRKFLVDSYLSELMGERARNLARARFSIEECLRRTKQVYESVINAG